MKQAQRIMEKREITSMLTADQIFKLGQQAERKGYGTLQDYAVAVLVNAASQKHEQEKRQNLTPTPAASDDSN